jgi:hypothetical protein
MDPLPGVLTDSADARNMYAHARLRRNFGERAYPASPEVRRMRVIEQTHDVLVVEEGPGTSYVIGGGLGVIGAFFAVAGWTRGPTWSLVAFGLALAIWGLWFVLSAQTTTHRFQRPLRRVAIESKRLRGSKRRELRFDEIADIVLEVSRRSRPSYYVHYVTTSGERIVWCNTYDGSKDDVLECFRAGREFLGLATPSDPPPAREES